MPDAETAPYVMTWDYETAAVTFTGPFASQDAAIAWGDAWNLANGDNLCWQVMASRPIAVCAAPQSASGDIAQEKQTCGRRMQEFGPWKRTEGLDTWRVELNGDRTCSFCGSMHPTDFLTFLKRIPEIPGARVEKATGKNYKFYVHRSDVQNASQGAIKFYTHHIPDAAAAAEMNEAYAPARELSVQRFQQVMDGMRGRSASAGEA